MRSRECWQRSLIADVGSVRPTRLVSVNRLSVRMASLPAPGPTPGVAATVDFLEWEIDGVSLRESYDAPTEMTLLQDDEWLRPHRIEAIARLRGELMDPPSYAPEFHRTRWDERLRRGRPSHASELLSMMLAWAFSSACVGISPARR